jgi:enamine deaminase RidA (YjgF/YER057c/UK114 family)
MNDPVQYVNPKGVCSPLGMYSHLARVQAGELLFVAGQVAVDAQGALVGRDDFAAQLRQVFENLRAVLGGAGAGLDDVVKLTTYLVGPRHVADFMRARTELFPQLFRRGTYPPNTLLVIDRLVKDEFLIEVEAIARARS